MKEERRGRNREKERGKKEKYSKGIPNSPFFEN